MKTRSSRFSDFTIAAFVFLSAAQPRLLAAYAPPASGLVGWWSAEGNANDSSGNGHNGTAGAAVSYAASPFGQAFNLPTGFTSSRVTVPDDPAFNLTSSLSIGAMVYLTQDEPSATIMMRGDNFPGLHPYVFAFGSAGGLDFLVDSGSGYTELLSPSAIPHNQWVQVTATLDGSSGDMRIYLNGILDAEQFTALRPANLAPSSQTSLGIGNTSGSSVNFPFVGEMDEVVLYNRALTPAEVTALAVPEPSVAALGLIAASVLVLKRRE